jgi:aspartyl protease family protein
VDTGASEVMLTGQDANTAHIVPAGDIRVFSTANGVVKAHGGRADISVGPISLEGFKLYVSDVALPTSLLGMSFLNKFQEIKFDNDKLYLKISAAKSDNE